MSRMFVVVAGSAINPTPHLAVSHIDIPECVIKKIGVFFEPLLLVLVPDIPMIFILCVIIFSISCSSFCP